MQTDNTGNSTGDGRNNFGTTTSGGTAPVGRVTDFTYPTVSPAEDPNSKFIPCHKILILRADVPCLNGNVFSKAALDELAIQNPNLLIEGDSLYGFVPACSIGVKIKN